MGAEQSDTNISEYLRTKLTKELTDYINGEIQKNSLRYIFFLMNANNFINHDQFYTNSDIHKISDYINDLKIIEMKDAKIIIQKILQISSCDEVAKFNLQIILSKMRVKFKDSYISPLYSKDLFNQLFSTEYKTQWGKYKPTIFINWNSPDVISGYQLQKQQTLQQIFNDLYQLNYYVKSPNIDIPICYSYPVLHSDDLSTVVTMNYVENLYINNNYQAHQGIAPFKKKIVKPTNWQSNIHIAALHGDEASVLYCLHLLPILLNCPNNEGNTPAHMAAIGDRPNIIKLLFNFGSDFKQKNKDGFLPHHLCTGKNSIIAFNSIGVDLNELDTNGNSLLDIQTRNFNLNAIETLLLMNVDILNPNPQGVFWFQFVIHGEYYKKDSMNFVSFQKTVRKILQKSLKKEVNTYPAIKEILARQNNNLEDEDVIDINNSVTNRDNNRFQVLLALGAHADRVRNDGKTNLMLCAERNDFKMAEILINNFCDPNFKNEKGENTFWVASYLMNFETATVLRDHGANLDELSSSGETILHVAYREGKKELFKFLLDSGCNPNVKNKDQESVLFQAFSAKDDEIAELIQTKYGGEINTQAHDGNSLAHDALYDHDYERLEYYIKRGIDIEIKNNFGYSIFMLAIIVHDDLELCSSLLSHGSDINTQDVNGNTALLNVLHLKKFDRNKFDFLINNNCNVNIKNMIGEYAISVCIARELNEEANILLSKNCIIQDINCEFEPIACALNAKSQFWFEKLIELGSNASNTKYPILVKYINSDFFNFDVLKKISSMNTIIGGPIQAAIKKGYNEVADFLWDSSDEQTKREMSKTSDYSGMIPLSAAIVYDCKNLVNKLLNDNYELMLPDKQNRTPFSYACQVNEKEWMEFLFPRITPQNLNLVDNIGNSALTYSACNKNVKFCNFLFINNVDIFNINADHNGIIESYRQLLNKFKEVILIAIDNVNAAESKFNFYSKEVDRLVIRMRNNDINRYRRNDSIILAVLDVASSISNLSLPQEIEEARDKKENARIAYNKYLERHNRLKTTTRKDLIQNFNLVLYLAKNDGDIPLSKRITDPNFNNEQFINKIFSILGVEQQNDSLLFNKI